MQLLRKRIARDANIFLYSCDHEGNSLRSDDGFKKMVDMLHSIYKGVKAPQNWAVDHGDPIEGISIDDPRYDGVTTNACVLEQIDMAIAHRKSIRKKIITMLDSNHPQTLWRYYGKKKSAITEHICKELEIPFGTWTSRISYRDFRGRKIFNHYATHGRKSITSIADDPKRRKANLELILKRHLKFKAGDCYLMSKAHVHKIIIAEPDYELFITGDQKRLYKNYRATDANDDWIHPDHRWYCSPGSFLALFGVGMSGYAEIAEYDPVELGWLIVLIRGGDIVGVDKIVNI